MRGVQDIRFGLPTGRAKDRQRFGCLARGIRRPEQTLGLERGAAARSCGRGDEVGAGRTGRRGRERRAGLIQIRKRAVIEQRLACPFDDRCAASDDEIWIRLELNAWLADRDAADQPLRVVLRRLQRRTGTIGYRRSDDDGVGRAEGLRVRAACDRFAALFVQRVEREPDRVERVAAPILLRVLLRVCMLDRDPIRHGRVESRQVSSRNIGSEGGSLAGGCRAPAHPVDAVDGVGCEIVYADASAFVGIRDDAAVFEAPLTRCADRAVDAAGAARCGCDDARILGIERGGNLRHQSHVLRAGAVVGVGDVLGACDLALGGERVAVDVDVGPVERAVTSAGIDIDQRSVVVVDREPAQLGRSRIHRIGNSRSGAL